MTAAGVAEPFIRLSGLELGFGRRPVVAGVDLEVRPGDFLAILGPNGAGKTTLLRAILGILAPRAGTRVVRGRLGYSPQRGALDPIFPLTAGEVVAMGLLGGARLPAPERAERVARALAACGLEQRVDAQFRDLSGGQKQRVLVARALVTEPDVLLLDEPTNDLDLRGEHEVMELLASLHAGGQTVVMVTHLLHLVARYARRVAFVHGGRMEEGDADTMLSAPQLERLYGVAVEVGELDGRRVIAPRRAAPLAPRADEAAPGEGPLESPEEAA